jgi:excisionase family DNA binding protein
MDYLTTGDVARELKLSIETVRRLIRSGALRASPLSDKPGRAGYRIRRADLEAFLEARARGGQQHSTDGGEAR